jgi:peptide deformylase
MTKIFDYPSPILLQQLEDVPEVNDGVRDVADVLFSVLDKYSAVGIGANQIGSTVRVIAVDVEGTRLAIVNPHITHFGGETWSQEGCLSFPGVKATVMRFASINVEGLDLEGNHFETQAAGLLAHVLQHEIDHVNGLTLMQRVPFAERSKMLRQLKKGKRFLKKVEKLPKENNNDNQD